MQPRRIQNIADVPSKQGHGHSPSPEMRPRKPAARKDPSGVGEQALVFVLHNYLKGHPTTIYSAVCALNAYSMATA